MGRAKGGGFNTAPLKRYPEAFCRALGSVISKSAEIIPHVHSETDEYETVFNDLRAAYISSRADGDDGADYAPQMNPKNNLVQDPPKAVS